MLRRLRPITLLVPLALLLLAGCGLAGADPAEALAARKEAEGKALGGACRHAGRALEDCYALNKRADKAALFAGWREMNDYMRENKIDAVVPQGAALAEAPADKPAEAGTAKPEAAGAEGAGKAPAKKPAKGKKQDG